MAGLAWPVSCVVVFNDVQTFAQKTRGARQAEDQKGKPESLGRSVAASRMFWVTTEEVFFS
jgi:hypothetical protein